MLKRFLKPTTFPATVSTFYLHLEQAILESVVERRYETAEFRSVKRNFFDSKGEEPPKDSVVMFYSVKLYSIFVFISLSKLFNFRFIF